MKILFQKMIVNLHKISIKDYAVKNETENFVICF